MQGGVFLCQHSRPFLKKEKTQTEVVCYVIYLILKPIKNRRHLRWAHINIIRFSVMAILSLFPCTAEALASRSSQDTITFSQPGENVIQARDTTHLGSLPREYQSLKQRSSKNVWTKKLFSFFVREAKIPDDKEMDDPIRHDYRMYEGKIIRNINVTVLVPFGTDIENPEYKEKELSFANDIHALSKTSTIKNLIQFEEGMPLNSAIIEISEAELRKTAYVYDARIKIDSLAHSSDSVDVNIIVRDKWTIGVNLHGLTGSRANIEVFDKNILGTGSRVGLDFIYSTQYSRKIGFGTNYLYRNIARTDISLEGGYIDRIKEQESSVSLFRTLRPKVDYFGEISYSKNVQRPNRIDWDSISPERSEKASVAVGRAFTLSDDNTIKRLALGFRYKRRTPEYKSSIYQERLKDVLLPYKYTRNQMYLMQLSLYENSYMRQYMVYNFGNTEDIPQGYNISLQLGYSDFQHMKNGMYGSLSVSYGSSNLIEGNIFLNTAISSFYEKENFFGGVYKFDAQYFTPLREILGLRYRQFLTLSYSKLLHPGRYLGDRIYMGEYTTLEMRDWRGSSSGFEQLLLRSETDIFSNYEVAGFRCLFYGFFDAGWITENHNLFRSNNLNYGYGIGFRFQNNFIVFNTIDLKIGVYPKLEQSGFKSFFRVRSSTPEIPANFIPSIPEEIVLE